MNFLPKETGDYKSPMTKLMRESIFGKGEYKQIFENLDTVYGLLNSLYGTFSFKTHTSGQFLVPLTKIENAINKIENKQNSNSQKPENKAKIAYLRLFLKALRAWDNKEWGSYEKLKEEKNKANINIVEESNTVKHAKGGVNSVLEQLKEHAGGEHNKGAVNKYIENLRIKHAEENERAYGKIKENFIEGITLEKRLANSKGLKYIVSDNDYKILLNSALVGVDGTFNQTDKEEFLNKLKTEPEVRRILSSGSAVGAGTGLGGGRRKMTRHTKRKGKGTRKHQTKKRN